LSGAGVSGLTSLAGGGVVGSGAGADAGGGGGGGASSFFLQPAKVKAQTNTVIIDNDRIPFSSLPPVTQKSLSTFYAYVDFTCKAPLHSRLWLNWTATKGRW